MMNDIYSIYPDPDVLLGLEPEELAASMFKILVTVEGGQHRKGKTFNPSEIDQDFLNRAMFATERNGGFYEANVLRPIILALMEGFQWMQNSGLIIPDPDIDNAKNGRMVLTRRARRMNADTDFRQFSLGQSIDRSLLHPAIANDVWRQFIRGSYATAVFEAMRAVEIAVREAAKYEQRDHGVPMIRRAFHKDTGPLSDLDQPEAEREALMHLFSGAIGSYKNPHSHRSVPLNEAKEAFEMVMLASHLLGIVGARVQSAQST